MPRSKKATEQEEEIQQTPDALTELLDKIDSIDPAGANGRTVSFLQAKSKELRQGLSTSEETVEQS